MEVGAYRSISERVSHLYHETLDDAVDDRVVVVFVLRVAAEVFDLVEGRAFSGFRAEG